MAKPEDTLTLETTKGKVVIAMRPDLAPPRRAHQGAGGAGLLRRASCSTRVIDGFMAQTGCYPQAQLGTGGSGKKLKAEFNKEPHVRGTVSMARAAKPDSATASSFICFDDASFLESTNTRPGAM